MFLLTQSDTKIVNSVKTWNPTWYCYDAEESFLTGTVSLCWQCGSVSSRGSCKAHLCWGWIGFSSSVPFICSSGSAYWASVLACGNESSGCYHKLCSNLRFGQILKFFQGCVIGVVLYEQLNVQHQWATRLMLTSGSIHFCVLFGLFPSHPHLLEISEIREQFLRNVLIDVLHHDFCNFTPLPEFLVACPSIIGLWCESLAAPWLIKLMRLMGIVCGRSSVPIPWSEVWFHRRSLTPTAPGSSFSSCAPFWGKMHAK